jgi:ergothioneine biosynthesis protein EgtB
MSNAITIDRDIALAGKYFRVRAFSDLIIAPLSPEDCMVQSMPDASPIRWHLGHTTWFFETFVLNKRRGYREFDSQFGYLFNSYYNAVGKQFPRPQRGVISRPGLEEIKSYRQHVDKHMMQLLERGDLSDELRETVDVGLNHEQQHQELILTDIKHVLSCNPTLPRYDDSPLDETRSAANAWLQLDEGLYEIGHAGEAFCFDNELPRHRVWIDRCEIARSLVTCGQYLEFIEDGGYQRPEHWLSLGWETVQVQGWDAPMYWVQQAGRWMHFTLNGLQPVHPDFPVTHVSYFEADALARWAGFRLPTEFEWEIASCSEEFNKVDLRSQPFADVLLDAEKAIHPTRSPAGLLGSVWQWTSSSYGPYPGYRPPPGALGEYNGKFMCNQYVLRGGSVATASDHIRPTYRNFFPPEIRWQFSGIRLARS